MLSSGGRILTAAQVRRVLGGRYTKAFLKKRIYQLRQDGWLVSLKRGLYFITDISSRGFVDASSFVIAQAFVKESYVSLESAFSFYNFFEQMLRTTFSVNILKSNQYVFQKSIYRYFKVRQKLYFGFQTQNIDGCFVKVAYLEKAILDYLYFRHDTYSIDIFFEKFPFMKKQIDLKRLLDYAVKFPETTKRKLGFILDLFQMDTKRLAKLVSRRGYSRLTTNSQNFNAQWRLYYEDRFVKQVTAGNPQ